MGPFVLITWEVMGVKHDKVEKKQGKGQTKGKIYNSALLLTVLTTMGIYVMLGQLHIF
jgi:hypothetical protein